MLTAPLLIPAPEPPITSALRTASSSGASAARAEGLRTSNWGLEVVEEDVVGSVVWWVRA